MSSSIPDLSTLTRERTAAVISAAQRAQIPPPPPRVVSRVVVPAALIVAFLSLLAYAGRDTLWPGVPVEVVPVVVKEAAVIAGASSFQAAGWVEPDPYPTEVGALADGVVAEVLVLEGQSVKAGQTVVTLVDDDARLARDRAAAALDRQRAALLSLDAAFAAAQADWDNPIGRVRAVAMAEAMVAESEGRLVEQVRSAEVAQAKIAELEDQVRREEPLVEKSVLSEGQLTQTRLKLLTERARSRMVDADRAVLNAQLAARKAELLAAREHLRLRIEETRALADSRAAVAAGKADVALAEAALAEAELRLERMVVRSPIDGVVMRRLANPGSKLMLGMDNPHSSHAVHLYDPAELQVRVDVPLADAARVGVEQKCVVVVEVLPDRKFAGVVSRIVNEADLQKNTLQVKVSILDPVPELKPEMLARVQFLATQAATSSEAGRVAQVFAPESLFQGDGSETHAWVVDKGRGVAERRTVTLGGSRLGSWIAVTSGLLPGDVLIVSAPAGLADGDRVSIAGESPLARKE